MKALVASILLLGWAGTAYSQDAVFVLPQPGDVPVYEEAPESIQDRPVGFQGIVAQIFRAFQPLQLINPFAPKEYGTGEQNLSSDKDWSATYFDSTELTVFGVEW